jgi:hypothetical protein
MKIEGYVICCPIKFGDHPWYPREHTFARTATEAWALFMNIRPDDIEWDRKITRWVNLGYCPKKTTMEVTW